MPSSPLFTRGDSAPGSSTSPGTRKPKGGHRAPLETEGPPRLNQDRFEAVCGPLDPALNVRPLELTPSPISKVSVSVVVARVELERDKSIRT